MNLNRRGFLGGIIASIAAPAIVKPFNLMPVVSMRALTDYVPGEIAQLDVLYGSRQLLTISQITREAVRLFQNSNAFIQQIDRQYDDAFNTPFIVGSQLRIKLPTNYVVTHD